MNDLLTHLAAALRAFAVDTADLADGITVVVLSEFGRRVAQNSSDGTDHGRGGLMMVFGGGINGGQVFGEWPGLSPLPSAINTTSADSASTAVIAILQ